jgi:hypothetical protein
MKYALLIYDDESVYGADKANPVLREVVARHRAFAEALGPKRIGGTGLATTQSATTVRSAGGAQTVHDGPFAETKEQLGGFYLIEVADLDEAIDIARRVPMLQEGAVEIRPLLG